MSLRGVSTIMAMTVLAEFGDLTRFDSPLELMAFVGLVPGEYSSGSRRRQGAITRPGNGHVRRLLIESAWAYRFPARKTAHLRRKGARVPDRGGRRSHVSSSASYGPSRVRWEASLTAPGTNPCPCQYTAYTTRDLKLRANVPCEKHLPTVMDRSAGGTWRSGDGSP